MKPNDNYLFHCSHCGYYVTDIVDGNTQYDELLERWAKGKEKYDDSISYFSLYCNLLYCPHCGKKVAE